MKKMMLVLLSVITISLATAGSANAQGGDKNIAFIPAKNHDAYVAFVAQNSFTNDNTITADDSMTAEKAAFKAAKANVKAAKANNKALKSFKNAYSNNAENVSWSFADGAMVATFSKDNVQTNVVYTKKGNWFHTVTYYPIEKTPQEVTDVMDIAYPKDNIKLTVKVEEGNITFYIVQLEGKTTLKKVTLYNGEVNLIEEFTKSK